MNTKLIASLSVLVAISASACSYDSVDKSSGYTVSAYTAEAHEMAPLTGLNSDPHNSNGTPVPQVSSIYDSN